MLASAALDFEGAKRWLPPQWSTDPTASRRGPEDARADEEHDGDGQRAEYPERGAE